MHGDKKDYKATTIVAGSYQTVRLQNKYKYYGD